MLKEFSSMSVFTTVVSRIHAPSFATLELVESIGGAYMRDQTFHLARIRPVFRGHAYRDVDLGLRNITDCCTEAGSTMICLRFSCPPETRWSRSPDRDRPQCRRQHFPSTPQVCPFNVLIALRPLADILAIDHQRIP